MTRQEFNDNIYKKYLAILYFNDAISDELFCDDISLNTLDNIFYMQIKNNKQYLNDIVNRTIFLKKLHTAYDYLRNYSESDTNHDFNLELSNEFLFSYDSLVNFIGAFKFHNIKPNSDGDNKNKQTREILFELSILRPIILHTLTLYEKYISWAKNDELYTLHSNTISLNLSHIIDQNNGYSEELSNAFISYRKSISNLKEHKEIYYNVGEEKKFFRLTRNKVLNYILHFYKELMNLYNEMYKIIYQNEKNRYELDSLYNDWKYVSDLYQYGIKYIESGPNYYSYLTKDEKEKISKNNKLSKKMRHF